jgi:hypothetical protein
MSFFKISLILKKPPVIAYLCRKGLQKSPVFADNRIGQSWDR